ncbi:MAG: ATP-binding protein [Candidatus Hodarchaeales archaeon]|jgi:PAS domain S-box-containing protein
MHLIAFIPLSFSLISIIAGGFVLLKNQFNRINKIFFLMSLFVSYSLFAEFLFFLSTELENAIFWSKAGFVWPWIFVLFSHFFFEFTRKNKLFLNRATVLGIYFPAVLFSILQIISDLLLGTIVSKPWGWDYMSDSNIIRMSMVIWINLITYFFIYTSVRYYRNQEGIQKQQAKWIAIGFIVGAIFALSYQLIPIIIGLDIPTMNSWTFFPILLCFTWAMWKYELFSLNPILVADSILTTMSNYLILFDSERKILHINSALEDILPNEREEVIGMEISDFIFSSPSPNPEFQQTIERAFTNTSQAPQTFELSLNTNQNEAFPFLITLSAMNHQGTIQGYVGVGVDLSSRKVLEDLYAREKAILKANEILKRTVTTISHEFRTPLSALQMAASSLTKYKDKLTNEQSLKMYSSITESTKSMTKMIEKVTTLSEIQDKTIVIKLEEYSPFKLINRVLSLLASKIELKKLIIDLDVPEKILLQGSKSRINQIFRILFENAIQYSPDEGNVLIKAIDLYEGVNNEKNKKGVLFQIIDEGSGIHPDELPFIFERFYRTKEVENVVGTGVGLVIARGLVHLHEGSIFADSEYKKGSTFSVFLPYLPKR